MALKGRDDSPFVADRYPEVMEIITHDRAGFPIGQGDVDTSSQAGQGLRMDGGQRTGSALGRGACCSDNT